MILIQKKLKYPSWKIPYFFIHSIIIFIKLANAGCLNLLINRDFFSRKINIIFKSIHFIFLLKKSLFINKFKQPALANLMNILMLLIKKYGIFHEGYFNFF